MNCKCNVVDLFEESDDGQILRHIYKCSVCGKKTHYVYQLMECYDEVIE